MMLGYIVDRLVCLSFVLPCVKQMLEAPQMYTFLTYWTLLVHLCYFSVDKASPAASLVARLMHGMSFCSAFAILAGYTLVSLGGTARFGSWLEWERHTGVQDLSSKSFEYVAALKAFEHLWPVLAHLLDSWLNHAALRRIYAGTSRVLNLALALGMTLAFGCIWEATMISADTNTNTLTKYNQPTWLSTAALLARVGMKPEQVNPSGLPEDLIFSTVQKVLMLGVSYGAYSRLVSGLPGAAVRKQKNA